MCEKFAENPEFRVVLGLGFGVTELVEPVLVLNPSLVSRVDRFSKQQAASSKQQASSKHARNGKKSQLHRGASASAKILVDGTYGCEGQPHKV